jgi:hypothetical protein
LFARANAISRIVQSDRESTASVPVIEMSYDSVMVGDTIGGLTRNREGDARYDVGAMAIFDWAATMTQAHVFFRPA